MKAHVNSLKYVSFFLHFGLQDFYFALFTSSALEDFFYSAYSYLHTLYDAIISESFRKFMILPQCPFWLSVTHFFLHVSRIYRCSLKKCTCLNTEVIHTVIPVKIAISVF